MSNTSALKEKLQALGLTANETKAYLALVRLGLCTTVQLSHESHLQRTEIYPLMARLVSKGLVEETIDKPRRFRPADVRHALPRLAMRTRNQIETIAKQSEQLATMLEGLAAKHGQMPQEEVRIIYGPQSARAHLLESMKSAQVEFWAMAGRRRPPHVSDRFLAEGLRMIASKGIKAKLILEVDKENLKRVRKMTAVTEIVHYQPIPVYAYGVDDKVVAVSLVQEPIAQSSQPVQLVSSYHPIVLMMRQFFDMLWKESTSFALREATLHGRRPQGQDSGIVRGRKEGYIHSESMADTAKDSIRVYIPTRYGPARVLKGLGEAFLRARRRGVKIRVICRLSDANIEAIKKLSGLTDVRHTDNPIGFSMGLADDADALIYYTDPDTEDLESQTDYAIRIASNGVRHLGSLFESLWEESTPIQGLLEKNERPPGESSSPS